MGEGKKEYREKGEMAKDAGDLLYRARGTARGQIDLPGRDRMPRMPTHTWHAASILASFAPRDCSTNILATKNNRMFFRIQARTPFNCPYVHTYTQEYVYYKPESTGNT